MDIQEQLVELRRKIARIDRKYAAASPAPPPPNPFQTPRPARYFVEELMSGEVVETAAQRLQEVGRRNTAHRLHGLLLVRARPVRLFIRTIAGRLDRARRHA